MTTLDPGEIIIGGNQHIFFAPAGTPLPAGATDALNAAFVDVGYTEQTGIKFTDNKTVGKVLPSQSFYPARYFVQDRESMVEFTMLQWEQRTVELAFGGGTWTSPSAGVHEYHPPAPETLGEFSLVADVVDGTRNFRFVVGSGFVTSNASSTFARTGPGLLPVTFSVLAPAGGGDAWNFLTDDAAFAAFS